MASTKKGGRDHEIDRAPMSGGGFFTVEMKPPNSLIPYIHNPKAHPETQIKKIAGSLAEYKFDQPIVVDKDLVIIKGHGRLQAALALGLEAVPVIVRRDLTPAQAKAARLADNKVAESAWFEGELGLEMQSLKEMDFDLNLTGFEADEILGLLGPPDDSPTLPGDDAGGPGGDEPGSYVIQYNIIFEFEEQQEQWFKLLRHLAEKYPGEITVAARLVRMAETVLKLDEAPVMEPTAGHA